VQAAVEGDEQDQGAVRPRARELEARDAHLAHAGALAAQVLVERARWLGRRGPGGLPDHLSALARGDIVAPQPLDERPLGAKEISHRPAIGRELYMARHDHARPWVARDILKR